MNAAINKAAAVVANTDFDEETWLVEPPNLPAQSDTTQGSGRIIEWLQGATMNVDFQTRSALSRKLASQAARRKKRAEKLLEKTAATNGHTTMARQHLARVQEELTEINQCNDDENENDESSGEWNENGTSCTMVKSEKSVGRRLEEVLCEQLSGISGTTNIIPSRGNVAVLSDDDENDEFYDASSDFNDMSRTPSITTANFSNNSSTLASTTAKANETHDKMISNGAALAAVNECVEPSVDDSVCSISSPSSNGVTRSQGDARYVRQANTARVSPMIMQNATSQRTPRLDKLTSLYTSAKSHLQSAQPDLKDIKSIVERQEAQLREELGRLKCSVEIGKTPPSKARILSQVQSPKPATPLASSRSVDFSANGIKLSAAPSQVSHASRLPTPVQRNIGRSMIPIPRNSVLSRSAIRGLAGGSTPSLVVPLQHTADETRSECGGMSRNEQRWTDECF